MFEFGYFYAVGLILQNLSNVLNQITLILQSDIRKHCQYHEGDGLKIKYSPNFSNINQRK